MNDYLLVIRLFERKNYLSDQNNQMRSTVLGLLLFILVSASGQKPALKVYTPKNSEIPQVQVMNLRQAPDGALWVCTYGGIGRFNGKRFTNYSVRNGLSSNISFDAAFHNDTIWLLSRDGLDIIVNGHLSNMLKAGMYKFYDSKLYFFGSTTRLIYNISTMQIENQNHGHYIFDLKTRKYITSFYYKNQQRKIKWFTFPINETLYYAEDSLILKFTTNNPSATLVKKFNGFISSPLGSGKDRFICMLTNKLPLYHYDSIIDVYVNNRSDYLDVHKFNRPETLDMKHLFFRPFNVNGRLYIFDNTYSLWDCTESKPKLVVSNISNINEVLPSTNSIWIASEKGLVKLQNQGFSYFNPSEGFPDNVWSVLPLQNNEVMFGTYADGLQIFDSTKRLFKNMNFVKDHDNALILYYNGALRGFNNDVILPNAYGLTVYNCKTRKVKIVKDNLDKTTLTVQRIPQQKLILAGNMHTLVALDRHYKTKVLLDLQKLNHKATILAIEPYKNGYLLGLNRGLAYYDSITHLGRIISKENIRVNDLITDSCGTIWAATSQGLMQFVNNSLVSTFTNSIRQDILTLAISNDHRLFLGGATLLYTINLNRYHSNQPHQLLAYGETAGYLGGEPGQNSFYKDERGWLWLPTSDNVVRIKPSKIAQPKRLPKATMVKGFAIDQTFTDTLNFFPNDTIITVPFSHNNLHFEFEAVELDFPESLRFQYSIEELSDRWFDLLDETNLETGELWPGTYTLRVRATISESFDHVPEAVITINVKAPFWLTKWFITLVGLLVVLLIWLLIRYLIHRERKQSRQKMEVLHLRAQAIGTQMDNHFLVNCTSKIALLNQQGKIDQAATYAIHFVRFLQRNLRSLRQSTIALSEELEMLKAYAALENNDLRPFNFTIKIEEGVDLEKTQIPTFLLQPIVENAIRHGIKSRIEPGGEVSIEVSTKNGFLAICISDNGTGNSNEKSGNRLSMDIVAERLKLLGKGSHLESQILNPGYRVTLLLSNS